MKKVLGLTLGILLTSGTLVGCAKQAQNNNQNNQEKKADVTLSDEEIIKKSISNFIPDKNLNLSIDTEVGIDILFNSFSVQASSKTKVDKDGNIDKEYSEKTVTPGEEETDEQEHVFLKKTDNSYDKYDIKDNKATKGTYSTDDIDTLTGIKVLFSNGDATYNQIKDREYSRNGDTITLKGKIVMKELGEQFYLNMKELAGGGMEFLLTQPIPFEAEIDAKNQEIKSIKLNIKEIYVEALKNSSKEEFEDETERKAYESVINSADIKGEVVIKRSSEEIPTISYQNVK